VKTFGDRLRHARKAQGWTQKALGEASGLSQSAIGNYESGQRYSSRALLRLAAALNVSPRWLDSGQGPMQEDGGPAAPGAGPTGAGCASGAWPFLQIPYGHYQGLAPRDKRLLERTVQAFIDSCRASYDKGPAASGHATRKRGS